MNEVAGFLYYRFAQDSPSDYRAWRAERGYRFKSLETLKRPWMIDKDFPMLVRDGFFIPGDSGSVYAHVISKDRKKLMPPPGKGDPWTKDESEVLRKFVDDLETKQQKKK